MGIVLYDHNNRYTPLAMKIDEEVVEALKMIFERHKGVDPRHLAGLMHTSVQDVLCEVILSKDSEEC